MFGQVLKGMDVVKAIEAVGSQGGETSKKVSITDCGEIKFGEDGFCLPNQ